MAELARNYPRIWRVVDELRADRGRGLPKWPEWCFLPMAGTYAIARGGGANRPEPLDTYELARIGALVAWRASQGIYRFDKDVLTALWETPVEGNLPADLLFRLPEWCPYIETPDLKVFNDTLHGFFVHLEWDANTGQHELRLLMDFEDSFGVLPIFLFENPDGRPESLDNCIALSMAQTEVLAMESGVTLPELTNEAVDSMIDAVTPLISMTLYLCSVNADIRSHQGDQSRPERPQPRRTKKGPRIFPPDNPRQWDVGWRLGAALRRAQEEAPPPEDAGSREAGVQRPRPRPHIRRAHWHSFWHGPKDGPRELRVRWLPPVPVAVDEVDELVPTVRTVE